MIEKILALLLKNEKGNTAALFLIDDLNRNKVVLSRYVTESSNIATDIEIEFGDGLVGFAAKHQKKVSIDFLSPKNLTGINYYKSYTEIGSFYGYPIKKRGQFTALLILDKIKPDKGQAPRSVDLSHYGSLVESALVMIDLNSQKSQSQLALNAASMIIERISLQDSFKDFLRELQVSLRNLVYYDKLLLLQYQPDGYCYLILDDQSLSGESQLARSCRAGHIFLQNRMINQILDESMSVAPTIKPGIYRSFLALPIFFNANAKWGLVLLSRKNRLFSKEIEKGMSMIASSLGSILTAQRLHETKKTPLSLSNRIGKGATFEGCAIVINLSLIGFRHVNQNLGFDGGDKLINAVLQRLRSLNIKEVVHSHAGNYLLFADVKNKDEGRSLMLEVLNLIEKRGFIVSETEVLIKAAVGASISTSKPIDIEDLILESEVATKKVKSFKGDRILFYDEIGGNIRSVNLLKSAG